MLEKITVPNSASTIDGVPAIISTVDSTTRARAKGRPNSLSQTAIAMPERQRDRDADRRDDEGPDQRVEEAAGLRLGEAGLRRGREQLGAHVLDPLDQHVDDDRRGDRAEEQPEEPAEREADPVGEPPGGTRLDGAVLWRPPAPA